MKKHFLVTATGKKDRNHGLRFFAHFFDHKEDITVTLFYTAPRPPEGWDEKRTMESERLREAKTKEYRDKGEAALKDAKSMLGKAGFASDRIHTKVQSRMGSRSGDIIYEGSQGNYDAVVIGRRGLSRLEEAFDESVSRGILEKEYDFPIWICRMPDIERRNVLICLDGSDPSFRITDHTGFILRNEKKHRATLLRIKKDSSGPDTGEIFEKAASLLVKNGFPENMIDTRELQASDPAKAILKEAEKDKFAAVAAGWTGTGKGGLKRLFSGSNCYKLFRELKHAALWTSY